MKVIYNAHIYLSKNNFCEALLIKDGRIFKNGTTKEILDSAPYNTEKIDAQGAFVLSAFYDSHIHLMWAGRREQGIECAGADSVKEIIKRGKEYIIKNKPAPGTYIRGSGADPDKFNKNDKCDLNRTVLDKITTEHPLIISRHCGHVIYCNSAALQLAGISESAPNINGGSIEKDEDGKPTGVLKENASVFVQSKMPAPNLQERKTHIRIAMEKAFSLGITKCGSYDADGPDYDEIIQSYKEVYEEYKNEGKAGLRVGMQLGISLNEEILDKHITRYKNNPIWQDDRFNSSQSFLEIQSIKLFADGTLGGHTAFMREPYFDKPETQGFPLMEKEKLDRFVQKADSAGIQVLVHAIGDAGIDMVLNAFEKVTKPGYNPLGHGIIHCQITTPDLLNRMARNKIIALIQPGFLENDMHILESRVGKEKASTSYAWGEMIKIGIPVRFSTDAPVSDLNPLHCIEWAIKRGVDIYDAVDAYINTVKTGGFADLVFLDKDIFSVNNAEDLQKVKVLRTICAGVTVYDTTSSSNPA